MQNLTKTDLQFVASRLPKDVAKAMKDEGLFLGGGFIRSTIAGEKVSDIDLFAGKVETLRSAANSMAAERKGRCHTTDNAITVLAAPRLPVQFITRWTFEDVSSLVESFDFTVCRAAIWRYKTGRWDSLVDDDFYIDLAARRLSYRHPVRDEDAGGSMIRVIKFVKRGYTIQPLSLAGVIARVSAQVDREKARDEQAATRVIAGLLREVDPLVVVDGMDLIDEHQVVA